MQVEVGNQVFNVVMWDPSVPVLIGDHDDPIIGVDTETEKLDPAKPAVPVIQQVCSLAAKTVHIVTWEHMDAYNRMMFRDPLTMWVFQNAPFDLDVMGLERPGGEYLQQVLESGRIVDVGIRWLLKELAEGRVQEKWNLELMAKLELGIEVPKDDDIRLSFRRGMTFDPEHVRYAATDPIATAMLFYKMPEGPEAELNQILGFVALSAIGRRGLMVDRVYLKEIREKIEKARAHNEWTLGIYGYHPKVKGNQGVVQSILEHVEKEVHFLTKQTERSLLRTPTGMISLTNDSLDNLVGISEHPFVEALKGYMHQTKMLETYLDEGSIASDGRVHPVFEPVKKTARTSCRNPPLQQLPRKEGIRGIYIPGMGYLFYACDYKQLELCTLAESCLIWYGKSTMADLLNAGVDLHRWFASQIVKKSEADVTDKERQMAKACNFGFPGGLGAAKFQVFANTTYGVKIDIEECKRLKALWLDAFPEMKQHFCPPVDHRYSEPGGDTVYIGRTLTGRLRLNCSFCSACNYPFQGLAAEGAKMALYYLWRERFPVVNFVHDETITELRDDDRLQDNIRKINELMIAGMRQVVTHVPIGVEGALMRRWRKEAKPVFDSNGNLLVWEDVNCVSKEQTTGE